MRRSYYPSSVEMGGNIQDAFKIRLGRTWANIFSASVNFVLYEDDASG